MAIRLSLDLSGCTCGDILRFADSLRAAGAPADRPVERGGRPDTIEVVVDGPPEPPSKREFRPPIQPSGPPESYGVPASFGLLQGPAPAHPHGPPPGHPHSQLPPPIGVPAPAPSSAWVPHRGGVIRISDDGRAHESHVSAQTLHAWRTALTQAIEPGVLSDPARAALLELREMLRPRRGFTGGS